MISALPLVFRIAAALLFLVAIASFVGFVASVIFTAPPRRKP